jgi:hypothetical protein
VTKVEIELLKEKVSRMKERRLLKLAIKKASKVTSKVTSKHPSKEYDFIVSASVSCNKRSDIVRISEQVGVPPVGEPL